ncbi:unnamed protein product [Adineta steineri]|uniref:Uncharacterized protein n=1 Tax=Adineta steineri TaxID=433720 RepID=A0A813WCI2_9BILA|nr:unnamed protein product [Adineta steineri]CAF3918890.1 unnamed protein product [Adineta steineri]
MASNREQKPCIGCEKGVATCSGCEKHFCLPHFTEHRQKLDKRMDEVMHEHDQLLEALKPQGTVHPLMSQIDTWEQASIQKIKDTAKQAREDLQSDIIKVPEQKQVKMEKDPSGFCNIQDR